ncbi:MAG: hypothetical protein R2827_13725 [Bdellovibrionales bacterium]
MGFNPLFFTKFITLLTGLFYFKVCSRLLPKFNLSKDQYLLGETGLLIFSLSAALTLNTPDLLFLGLFLLLVLQLWDLQAEIPRKNLWVIPLIVASLAMVKAYGLYMGLFTVFVQFLVRSLVFKKSIVSILKRFAFISLGTLLLLLPWGLTLKSKYGFFTFGYSASYSREVIRPESFGEHPMFHKGIVSLPHEQAVSGFEDPIVYDSKNWSPFESQKLFFHQIKVIGVNLYKLFNDIQFYSMFSIVILIFAFRRIFAKGAIDQKMLSLQTILFSMTLVSGYMLILVVSRYVMVTQVFLFLLGLSLLATEAKARNWTSSKGHFLSLLLALSFYWNPVGRLVKNWNMGFATFQLAHRIPEDVLVDQKVSSNRDWRRTTFICLIRRCRNYGQVPEESESYRLKEALDRFKIDLFFEWSPVGPENQGIEMEQVYVDDESGLKIYRIARN